MMLLVSLNTLVLLAAAPTPPVPQLRLASPGLSATNVKPELGALLSEHVAQQLKLAGAEVVTPKEIGALLGLERQKQLTGCTEEASSCTAELAAALGVDGLVLGDVGRVGERYLVNLKVVASKNGKTVAAFSETANSEDAVLDVLTRGARALAEPASSNLGRSLSGSLGGTSTRTRLALIPLAVGVLAAGVGGVFLLQAQGTYASLANGSVKSASGGRSLQADGEQQQTVARVGLGVGAAGLVAAAVMYFATPTSGAMSALVAPTPGGAAVVFSGRWP